MTYDYRCPECLYEKQVKRAMDDEPEQEWCPDCSEVMYQVFFASPSIWKTTKPT